MVEVVEVCPQLDTPTAHNTLLLIQASKKMVPVSPFAPALMLSLGGVKDGSTNQFVDDATLLVTLSLFEHTHDVEGWLLDPVVGHPLNQSPRPHPVPASNGWMEEARFDRF